MLAALWLRFQGALLLALAVAAVLVGAYYRGGSSARKAAVLEAQRVRQAGSEAALAERHEAIGDRNDVETRLATRLPAGAGAAERLRADWARD